MRKLTIEPEAEAEIAQAADWYNERNSSIRENFLRQLDLAISAILENPELYQVIAESKLKRAPVDGFPYGVIYRILPDEIIVVACFHGRRDPFEWHSRS